MVLSYADYDVINSVPQQTLISCLDVDVEYTSQTKDHTSNGEAADPTSHAYRCSCHRRDAFVRMATLEDCDVQGGSVLSQVLML